MEYYYPYIIEYFLHNAKIAAVICLIAYLLTKNSSFSRAWWMMSTPKDKVILSILFGMVSIIGDILGYSVFTEIIIQSRQIGPVVGGIIAGPIVGITAGFIGGFYDFFKPEFLDITNLISNIIAGSIGGLFYHRLKEKRLTFKTAFLSGLIAEIIWNVLVLILAKPPIIAKLVIRVIGPITTIVNPIGIAIFITFVKDIQYGKNLIGADYAEKALEIAKQTLPILKGGLNKQTAEKIVRIIHQFSNMHAIAITDKERILAYTGLGEDHHIPGSTDITSFTIQTMKFNDNEEFNIFIANAKEDIGCYNKDCPLDAVIIAPFICHHEVIGYIKAYKSGDIIKLPDIKMVSGIASLLSLQLENARFDEQAKLLAKAEYAALLAQINPHFLFNTLSVINLLIRKNPNQAREVILNLATFFRKTLNRNKDIIPFVEEIEVIRLYISIQKERFLDRLQVEIDILEEYEDVSFPAFALQQLVENSMNHGLSKKTGLLFIKIVGHVKDDFLFVSVIDNGLGFPEEVIDAVHNDYIIKGMGIGLTNINRRLHSLYGDNYIFELKNNKQGAEVLIKIPVICHKTVIGGSINEGTSFNC